MKLLAIDPGTTESGFVVMDTLTKKVLDFGKADNYYLCGKLCGSTGKSFNAAAIEQIKSYGNAMGDSTIETCVWIGRFIECWVRNHEEKDLALIPRATVKSVICHKANAKDDNVRRAILDRYMAYVKPSELGGGNEPSIGVKAKPGPLFGVKADVFSAIALALAWIEMNGAATTNDLDCQDFLK